MRCSLHMLSRLVLPFLLVLLGRGNSIGQQNSKVNLSQRKAISQTSPSQSPQQAYTFQLIAKSGDLVEGLKIGIHGVPNESWDYTYGNLSGGGINNFLRLADNGTVLYGISTNLTTVTWFANRTALTSLNYGTYHKYLHHSTIESKYIRDDSSPQINFKGNILFNLAYQNNTAFPIPLILLDGKKLFSIGDTFDRGTIFDFEGSGFDMSGKFSLWVKVRYSDNSLKILRVVDGEIVDPNANDGAIELQRLKDAQIENPDIKTSPFTYRNGRVIYAGEYDRDYHRCLYLRRKDGALLPGAQVFAMNESGKIITGDPMMLFDYSDAIPYPPTKRLIPGPTLDKVRNLQKDKAIVVPYGKLLGLNKAQCNSIRVFDVRINKSGQIAIAVAYKTEERSDIFTAIILGTPTGQQADKKPDDFFSKVLTKPFKDDAEIKDPPAGN